jgi:hypothetical protein
LIFMFALVAAAPAVFLFVLGPFFSHNPLVDFPGWRAMMLWGTPLVAAVAIVLYFRVPPTVRERGAARAGRTLAFATGALWLLFTVSYFVFLRRQL